MGEKQPRFEGNKIAKEEDITLDCKVDQKSQGTFPKSRLQKYHFTKDKLLGKVFLHTVQSKVKLTYEECLIFYWEYRQIDPDLAGHFCASKQRTYNNLQRNTRRIWYAISALLVRNNNKLGGSTNYTAGKSLLWSPPSAVHSLDASTMKLALVYRCIYCKIVNMSEARGMFSTKCRPVYSSKIVDPANVLYCQIRIH